jgi:hypothetical protein
MFKSKRWQLQGSKGASLEALEAQLALLLQRLPSTITMTVRTRSKGKSGAPPIASNGLKKTSTRKASKKVVIKEGQNQSIQFRKEESPNDNAFVPQTLQRLQHESSGNGFADRQKKRQELLNPFYRFDAHVKSSFETQKHKVDFPLEQPETPDGRRNVNTAGATPQLRRLLLSP